jgi:hypothetical protein
MPPWTHLIFSDLWILSKGQETARCFESHTFWATLFFPHDLEETLELLLWWEEILFLLEVQCFWSTNALANKDLSRKHELINSLIPESYRVRGHFLPSFGDCGLSLLWFWGCFRWGAWCIGQASLWVLGSCAPPVIISQGLGYQVCTVMLSLPLSFTF